MRPHPTGGVPRSLTTCEMNVVTFNHVGAVYIAAPLQHEPVLQLWSLLQLLTLCENTIRRKKVARDIALSKPSG